MCCSSLYLKAWPLTIILDRCPWLECYCFIANNQCLGCNGQAICLPNKQVCGIDGVTYQCAADASSNGINNFTNGVCAGVVFCYFKPRNCKGICPPSAQVDPAALNCLCAPPLGCTGSLACSRGLYVDQFPSSCTSCSCALLGKDFFSQP